MKRLERNSFKQTYPTETCVYVYFKKDLWVVSIHNLSFEGQREVVSTFTVVLVNVHQCVWVTSTLILQRRRGRPKISRRGSTCSLTWTPSPIPMRSAKLTQSTNFTTHSSSSASHWSEMGLPSSVGTAEYSCRQNREKSDQPHTDRLLFRLPTRRRAETTGQLINRKLIGDQLFLVVEEVLRSAFQMWRFDAFLYHIW